MTQYKTIDDLPAASSIDPRDLFELSQFGTSRKGSLQLLLTALGGAAPTGPAGGDLAGSYPNPTIKPSATNGQVLTTVGGVAAWAAAAASGGTVTTTSVVTANGFAGTVATPSTTPAITLGTTITGLLKGNGTAISAATAGTDYVTPGGLPTSLPPNGTASGDLAGTYPSPTIKASVGLTGSPTAPTPSPSSDSSTRIATTAFVQAALGGASVTIPAGSVAYGGAGGAVTGVLADFAWDSTNKRLGISNAAPAAALDVTAQANTPAFNMSGYNVTGSNASSCFAITGALNTTGNPNIFSITFSDTSAGGGAAFLITRNGTQSIRVSYDGLLACSNGSRFFAPFAVPAPASSWGQFVFNGVGGNLGTYYGAGTPTGIVNTFGRPGSLYLNGSAPGVPYYNADGATGWTMLAPITAVGTTAPANPVDGQLWFNNDASVGGGVLYIRYNDGNSTQWIAVSPPTSGPPVSLLEARVAELEARLAALEAAS